MDKKITFAAPVNVMRIGGGEYVLNGLAAKSQLNQLTQPVKGNAAVYVLDVYSTNKTNEIMKVLTFLSTIMLPLTVVSSIYGMNVSLPGAESRYAFAGIMIVMVIIAVAFLIYFKRRRWL